MSTDDVVVTGLGATTPLGGDVRTTWEGVLSGRNGISPLEADWLDRFDLPVRIAGQMAVEPDEVLPAEMAEGMDRCEQAAVVAAREAWADSGLGDNGVDPMRLAVVIGTGVGGTLTLLNQDDVLETSGVGSVSPLAIQMLLPNGPAARVADELGARARVHVPVSACASGAEALAEGWQLLRSGEVDVVVAGGAEACIHPTTLAGFSQARTMTTSHNDTPDKASRPFDMARDGLVLGEGAGVVVLERAGHAAARGARAYARLSGVGITSDAYHITAPHPDGIGQIKAMQAALRTSDIAATDVGHVNAHATSTPVGDIPEALAIRTAIGDHPLITAPKSALGHLLGAAGAVEAIMTLLAVHGNVVPPTRNLENLDPQVGLDVVAGQAREAKLDAAINDAFGFGGHNVVLCFTAA